MRWQGEPAFGQQLFWLSQSKRVTANRSGLAQGVFCQMESGSRGSFGAFPPAVSACQS